jgi:hypothetical protein
MRLLVQLCNVSAQYTLQRCERLLFRINLLEWEEVVLFLFVIILYSAT